MKRLNSEVLPEPTQLDPSPLISHLLAKSEQEAKGARLGQPQETLEEHTFLVVERLAGLMKRSPQLASIAGRPDFWHIAFWAAAIHDFGKAASGFQTMLRGGERFGRRHEALSLAFLPDVADADTWQAIALAVVSHHRDAAFFYDKYIVSAGNGYEFNPLVLQELDGQLTEKDLNKLRQWLDTVPEQWRKDLGFSERGAAERQGSEPLGVGAAVCKGVCLYAYSDVPDEDFSPQDYPWAILLRGLIQQADRLASAHAPVPQPFALPDAAELAKRKQFEEFRPHQRAAARAGHLILVAPTGSGKTEAALLWAWAQQQELGECRVTYSLPYQASLNAMQARLESDLGTDVAILHGRALQVLFQNAVKQTDGEDLDEEELQAATAEARRTNDYNRLHGPAVAVVTPYQLLRAAYRLPGYETVLASVAGSALILDEIHAYAPERLGMFMALLEGLVRRWGVRACVITATMPGWLRRKLEALLEVETQIAPREIALQNCRHRLQLRTGNIEDTDVLDDIAARVSAGESILVAVNTVKKGQLVMEELQRRLGSEQVRLLHSRLNGRDRRQREKNVLEALKAGNENKHDSLAVVATQVIEVSLDFDFDGIYSEPAPLEALVQRFGRVNRRGKKGKPAMLEGQPTQMGVVPVTVMTQPTDGQHVYNDTLVQRTLDVLRECEAADGLLHDDLLSGWLEQIYEGEALAELENEYQKGHRDVSRCMYELQPFSSCTDLKERFEDLFDGIDVLPKCFEAQYKVARETSPIQAREWLVSMSAQQVARFKNFCHWHEDWKLYVTDLEYDGTLGLLLQEPPERPKVVDEWGEM